jgi:hypothetical protein
MGSLRSKIKKLLCCCKEIEQCCYIANNCDPESEPETIKISCDDYDPENPIVKVSDIIGCFKVDSSEQLEDCVGVSSVINTYEDCQECEDEILYCENLRCDGVSTEWPSSYWSPCDKYPPNRLIKGFAADGTRLCYLTTDNQETLEELNNQGAQIGLNALLNPQPEQDDCSDCFPPCPTGSQFDECPDTIQLSGSLTKVITLSDANNSGGPNCPCHDLQCQTGPAIIVYNGGYSISLHKGTSAYSGSGIIGTWSRGGYSGNITVSAVMSCSNLSQAWRIISLTVGVSITTSDFPNCNYTTSLTGYGGFFGFLPALIPLGANGCPGQGSFAFNGFPGCNELSGCESEEPILINGITGTIS